MADSLGLAVSAALRVILKRESEILREMIVGWHKIVGTEFAEDTYPSRIYSIKEKGEQINILVIKVTNSSVSTMISYKSEMLIEKIAIYFGYKAITRINIKKKL
jgi:hypothetical protein